MCTVGTVQQGISWLIWGAISSEGVGPLAFIEGSVTGQKYIKTFNEHFLPLVKTREASGKPTFLQDDNATGHRANIVTKWKEDRGVLSLPWPAQSPDLNPIQNVWALLKEKVRNQIWGPSNKEELKKAITDEWQKLPLALIQNLVSCMESRIAAVITAKGYSSK